MSCDPRLLVIGKINIVEVTCIVRFHCYLEMDEMEIKIVASPKIDLMFQLVSVFGVRIK